MSEVRVNVWRVEQRSPAQYLLILQDDRRQLLPMTIGICEAFSIQSAFRPGQGLPEVATTHDLLGELIDRLGGRLAKVVIDDLWNKVYFAKLYVSLNGDTVTIDSRPSDAVAIALRLDAPLYATDSVMSSANEPDEPETSPETDLDPLDTDLDEDEL
ncbi:MAG: bifunctional nuclease family protein [Armatimonadetes bacterium]|nr:bifunctional nuclease family protein [Armatimonadota bacterium]